ncbi:MAG: hypothetical protein KF726_00170 [Anaerolineae bacterium]|nr:hypothetical protein [Anaerolineae bacterium]
MGISVQWENEHKTAIRQSFDGNWSWNDYNASVTKMREMIRSVTHTVDVISDIRASNLQVRGLAWQHFRSTLIDVPTNTGLIVVAGKGNFTASIFAIMAQSSANLASRTRFVPTLAEAYLAIDKIRHQRIQ